MLEYSVKPGQQIGQLYGQILWSKLRSTQKSNCPEFLDFVPIAAAYKDRNYAQENEVKSSKFTQSQRWSTLLQKP